MKKNNPIVKGASNQQPGPGKSSKGFDGDAPKKNPKPDTFPAKENERTPGVKRKNLPHDPMKQIPPTKQQPES